MVSLLDPAIISELKANNILYENLPKESSSVLWYEVKTTCNFSFFQICSLMRLRCEVQHFYIDLDGTIEGLRSKLMSLFERIRLAATVFEPGIILSENYTYYGDAFEGHKICLKVHGGHMVVVKFRPGTYDLLTGLSAIGQVHFYTHATNNFATSVTQFLNKVVKPATPFTCRSFRRPMPKSLDVGKSSFFVLDDHMDRWQANTVTHVIPTMLYGPNCGKDFGLYALMMRHGDIYSQFSSEVRQFIESFPMLPALPFDVILHVLSFVLRDKKRPLVFCRHFRCRAVMLAGEAKCGNCSMRS